MPMHIGQPAVYSVVAERQGGVIDAEQVQYCGVDIVPLRKVFPVERFVAPLVTRPVTDTSFNSAAA